MSERRLEARTLTSGCNPEEESTLLVLKRRVVFSIEYETSSLSVVNSPFAPKNGVWSMFVARTRVSKRLHDYDNASGSFYWELLTIGKDVLRCSSNVGSISVPGLFYVPVLYVWKIGGLTG